MTNAEVIEVVLDTIVHYKSRFENKLMNADEIFAECVNNVIRKSMVMGSEDNLTCIIIFFKNLLFEFN